MQTCRGTLHGASMMDWEKPTKCRLRSYLQAHPIFHLTYKHDLILHQIPGQCYDIYPLGMCNLFTQSCSMFLFTQQVTAMINSSE
jgi:hypothetical protein